MTPFGKDAILLTAIGATIALIVFADTGAVYAHLGFVAVVWAASVAVIECAAWRRRIAARKAGLAALSVPGESVNP